MTHNILTLKRIVAVQNVVLEYRKKGVSQKWIYENVIAETFFISKSTFDRYMCSRAKHELNKLMENEHSNTSKDSETG